MARTWTGDEKDKPKPGGKRRGKRIRKQKEQKAAESHVEPEKKNVARMPDPLPNEADTDESVVQNSGYGKGSLNEEDDRKMPALDSVSREDNAEDDIGEKNSQRGQLFWETIW